MKITNECLVVYRIQLNMPTKYSHFVLFITSFILLTLLELQQENIIFVIEQKPVLHIAVATEQ
jgi:membrane protein YqaA with SNARE-associated domain